MVKAYQRYALAEHPSGSLGVISSASCSDVLWADTNGTLALSAALDSVALWNLRTGTQVASLKEEGCEAEISALAASRDGKLLAAGYSDGRVRLWDRAALSLRCTLDGHKSAVTSLAFSEDGTQLASGSSDTDIVIWDVIAEAGLFRLRGHKDAVTAVKFLGGGAAGRLLSSSKDSLVKIWELEQQHCVQTLTGHRSEVWSVAVDLVNHKIVSGGADGELRIWSFSPRPFAEKGKESAPQEEVAVFVGSVAKAGKSRVGKLSFFANGKFLMCQTMDRTVRLFRIRSKEEAMKKMKKRLKRNKEKLREAADSDGEIEDEQKASNAPIAVDELQAIGFVSASQKIKSAAAMLVPKAGEEGTIKILTTLTNNAMEVWDMIPSKGAQPTLGTSLYQGGHRSDVRAISLSNDEMVVAACAGGETKLWNIASGQCFRTISTGYGVCCAFAPGDKYIIVGTKAGELQLLDIPSAEVVDNLAAHTGSVWSIALKPDQKGFISAGADKEVKFWDFGVEKEESGSTKLKLSLTKALTMEDDILSVNYSPNGKIMALALLDATVKLFYTDSMRFFLSLYGHRLPVLSLDMSSDSNLLVTGSADKNVKIWGLDFGDCHKSMLAHKDNVMAVRFVPRTHYFFSAGKDKVIKFWDADKFQCITTIKAHFSEVWCLAMGSSGDIFVSGSHDRSIRVWKRTAEQVFLEEEKQKEMDELLEDGQANNSNAHELGNDETAPVLAKESRAIMDAVDRITEALDVCEQQTEEPSAMGAAILLGKTPNAYFRHTLKMIRSSDLEPALLQLPFDYVLMFLKRAEAAFAEAGTIDAELVSKTVLTLVRLHHMRLASTQEALPILRSLRSISKRSLQERCDQAGYNLAALRNIRRRIQSAEEENETV